MATEPTTPATEEQAQPTQPETLNLKVVIHLRGDRASIGVHRPNTDPWIRIVQDVDLEEALAQAPSVLAEAAVHWAEHPRFPEYQRPPAPPATPRVTRPRAGQTAPVRTPAAPQEPQVQAPRMF
jgi:hypothetical protein